MSGSFLPPVELSTTPRLTTTRLFEFILDHNPCFILSALSMIFGCYLFSSALDLHAGESDKLLSLVATINLYEFALIGIAALIFARRHVARDGLLLLIIQSLFLCDATFLIAETVASHPVGGWSINVGLLLLALAKTALVLHVTRVPITLRTLGFMSLQLAILYLLPIWLWHSADYEYIRSNILYIAWWTVGMLPLLYDLLSRFILADDTRGPHAHFIRRLHLVIPWLMLIAHLSFFHWVYHADFHIMNLTPVLLGLAVATRYINPTRYWPAGQLRFMRYALPVLAVLFTLLSADHSDNSHPIALTLGATLITYTYLFDIRFAPLAVGIVGLLGFLYAYGPTPYQIQAFINKLLARIEAIIQFILPNTNLGWGIVAIIGAFILLALGSFVSLKRRTT